MKSTAEVCLVLQCGDVHVCLESCDQLGKRRQHETKRSAHLVPRSVEVTGTVTRRGASTRGRQSFHQPTQEHRRRL